MNVMNANCHARLILILGVWLLASAPGHCIPRPDSHSDALNRFAKSITAKVTNTNPRTVEVAIVVRVHWDATPSPASGSQYRSLEEQRAFDAYAQKTWTGSFAHWGGFKRKVIYDVKTTFESTYGDARDKKPSESATIILQEPHAGDSFTYPIWPPVRSGCKGSVTLRYGAEENVYAHEIGHVLGCQDSRPRLRWHGDIMGNPRAKPNYQNVEEILKLWHVKVQE
jgi:hypothetical protein